MCLFLDYSNIYTFGCRDSQSWNSVIKNTELNIYFVTWSNESWYLWFRGEKKTFVKRIIEVYLFPDDTLNNILLYTFLKCSTRNKKTPDIFGLEEN